MTTSLLMRATAAGLLAALLSAAGACGGATEDDRSTVDPVAAEGRATSGAPRAPGLVARESVPDAAILIALIDVEREMVRLSILYGPEHQRMRALEARRSALAGELEAASPGTADNRGVVRAHVAAALVEASARLAELDTHYGPEHPDRIAVARDRDYLAELSAALASR